MRIVHYKWNAYVEANNCCLMLFDSTVRLRVAQYIIRDNAFVLVKHANHARDRERERESEGEMLLKLIELQQLGVRPK